MADDQTTDVKDLLQQVCAFGEAASERRRFERQRLLWAAAVDVQGQRFEGSIIDLSPGGARLRFDAALTKGDELVVVMKQLEELGAKVIWQRAGETGVQFLLAPEDVAARVKDRLGINLAGPGEPELLEAAGPDAAEPPKAALAATAPDAPVAAKPAARAGKSSIRRLALLAAIGVGTLGTLVGGSVLAAGMVTGSRHHEEAPPPLVVIAGGAVGQHSCPSLLKRLDHATNQIDFRLAAAAAAQANCLDLKQSSEPSPGAGAHGAEAAKAKEE